MIIETNSDVIRGLLLAAATSQNERRQLNGVLVDLSGDQPVLVATNGKLLLSYRLDLASPEGAESFFVPSRLLSIVKRYPAKAKVLLSGKRNNIVVEYDGLELKTPHTVCAYPDWRGAYPRSVSGEAAQYEVKFLHAADRAGRIILGRQQSFALHLNGNHTAFIDYGSERLSGMIRPMCVSEQEPYEPPF